MKSFLKVFCLVILLTMFSFTESYTQDETGNFEFDGRTRNYEVYLPQNFQPNMPLVISLHGYTETIEWYKTYTLMHETADTTGFITVYPAAIDKSWNSGLLAPGWPTIDTSVDDVGFISALIDTLKTDYDIDMNRIYCCGFSLGGEMTYKLTGELGHRFAAVASVAGLINDNSAITCKPIRAFPILHIHGTEDTYETWNGDDKNLWTVEETVNFWVQNNNCVSDPDTVSLPDLDPFDGCTVEKISYTNCFDEGCFLFYKILNGGHHWPGAGFNWGGGNLNRDINANVEILNFFMNYKNPLVNVAFAKSKHIDFSQQSDTLVVRASLSNPENHPVSVFAIYQGEQTALKDSLELFDDGLHEDGEAADNIYGDVKVFSDNEEDIYEVKLRTTDEEEGITTYLHYPSKFTTIGPITYDGFTPYLIEDSTFNPGDVISFKMILKNNGSTVTAKDISAQLYSNIELIDMQNSFSEFDSIAAGGTKESQTGFSFIIDSEIPKDTIIYLPISVYSEDEEYWQTEMPIQIIISSIKTENRTVPLTFKLEQNYPNPFNPITLINYQLPMINDVELSIYNLLGQKVATLLSEKQNAGYHQVEWDASGFASGIYYYRIEAGDYLEMKKMVLIK